MKFVWKTVLAGLCLLSFLLPWDKGRAFAAEPPSALEAPAAASHARNAASSEEAKGGAASAGKRALSTDSEERAKEQLDLAARYVLLGAVVCGAELQDEETTGMLLSLMLKYRESADALVEHFASSLHVHAPETRALMENEQKMAAARKQCPEILQKRKAVLDYFSH